MLGVRYKSTPLLIFSVLFSCWGISMPSRTSRLKKKMLPSPPRPQKPEIQNIFRDNLATCKCKYGLGRGGGEPHNYCLGRKETGQLRLLFHAAVPRLPALLLGRQRSPRPESKVRARGPAKSSSLERCARGRPEHKAAPSCPATAPGPGPPRAHGARANTMHTGLGRGSCGARPRDFLVNRSQTPGPHPHPLPRGFAAGFRG